MKRIHRVGLLPVVALFAPGCAPAPSAGVDTGASSGTVSGGVRAVFGGDAAWFGEDEADIGLSYGGMGVDAKRPPGARSGPNGFVYDRGDVVEWYVPRLDGWEQGFTLTALPAGDGPLALAIDVVGAVPVHDPVAESLRLERPDGTSLGYGGLVAWDADGQNLPAWFEVESSRILLRVDATGAALPVTIDPVLTTPMWTWESNWAGTTPTAGLAKTLDAGSDANGDGYGDLLFGATGVGTGRAWLWAGSSTGLGATELNVKTGVGGGFGGDMAFIGDVNGDTRADYAVGSLNYNGGGVPNSGRVDVYYGSLTGSDFGPSIPGTVGTGLFGAHVGPAGDVNNDGFDDLFVGESGYGNGQSNEGRGHVFNGAASGLSTVASWKMESDQASANFGLGSASADVNHDAFDDLVVSAPMYDDATVDGGKVWLYLGGAGGLATSSSWSFAPASGPTGANLRSLAFGDFNGDGWVDLAAGAKRYQGYGAVFVFNGSAVGFPSGPSWTYVSDQLNSEFGEVATGNVNGDAYADLLVGATKYSSGQPEEGAAFLFLGTATGFGPSWGWRGESDVTGVRYGRSVALGDLNKDGYDEIVVGAELYDNPEVDEGKVWVYKGDAAIDFDADGSAWPTDCNDLDAAINPGAVEIVGNQIDNNCDGKELCFADLDNDGQGGSSTMTSADVDCKDSGEAVVPLDCNDGDATIYQYAPEICDSRDEDCTGLIDDLSIYANNFDSYASTLGGQDGWLTPSYDPWSGALGNGVYNTVDNANRNDILLQSSPSVGDFVLDTQFTVPTDDDALGVVFRYVDTQNFYAVYTTRQERPVGASGVSSVPGTYLVRVQGGTITDLASTPRTYTNGWKHRLRVKAQGSSLTVWFDDDSNGQFEANDAIGPVSDAAFASGLVGYTVYNCGNGVPNGCSFDDLLVRPAANVDADSDSSMDRCDNCPTVSNTTQADLDGDKSGDACDADDDGDAVLDVNDNCSRVANLDQADLDKDGAGDVCDADDDGDSVLDATDNCSRISNVDQKDTDADKAGDACDTDDDGDGKLDASDNCPTIANADQKDTDLDGLGDACDVADQDGDGYGYEDCNDSVKSIHPNAAEVVADGIDQDCDKGDLCWRDGDADGFRPDAISTTPSADLDCLDAGEAGNSALTTDCDDANAAVKPGAVELAGDEIDQNCDKAETCWKDADSDGYRPDATSTVSSADVDCKDAGEAVSSAPVGDCNDSKDTVKPGAAEGTGDSVDSDCDGKEVCYDDADDDGVRPITPATRASADADCADSFEATATDATGDCDDTNKNIKPSATELAGDGVDSDCSGGEVCYRDADDDGYRPNATDTIVSVDADCADAYEATASDLTTDCNDTAPLFNPSAVEQCDGKDNDCDGTIDDNVKITTWYADTDSDGTGDTATTKDACSQPAGYVDVAGDCDDKNGAIHPGAQEICDSVDQDCDGQADEGVPTSTWYADTDGDGSGDLTSQVTSCGVPTGYVGDAADCDDKSAVTHPGASELCDLKDNNCDGQIDENTAPVAWFADVDKDGAGNASDSQLSCAPVVGRVLVGDDCNDTKASVNPRADELCNTVDDDCDGTIDDAPIHGIPAYDDGDGDGFGDPFDGQLGCSALPGHVENADDCDDADALANPDAVELCDDVDNNCNGIVDDGAAPQKWYADADADGYGDALAETTDCDRVVGASLSDEDCDDTSPVAFPGAPERCDGLDNDCDGKTDEGVLSAWYADLDGDGWGDAGTTTDVCDPGPGWSARVGDCDDSSLDSRPGAPEQCNGLDDDCDQRVDDDVQMITWYDDDDGDGYGDLLDVTEDCSAPPDTVSRAGDCDDRDAALNPSAVEICDEVDQDCDGVADDGLATTTLYVDADDDGHGIPGDTIDVCGAVDGYAAIDDDCDDTDNDSFPGAPEVWYDGKDEACDQGSDFDQDGDTYDNEQFDGDDCDDKNPAAHPGATEDVGGEDLDCDGLIEPDTDTGQTLDTDSAINGYRVCGSTNPAVSGGPLGLLLVWLGLRRRSVVGVRERR